jgi:hypothetical protein
MYSVLDFRTLVPFFDKLLDYSEVVLLARFETLAVMKNKLIVLSRDDLLVYIRYPSSTMRHCLQNIRVLVPFATDMEICDVTASSTPKAILIKDDLPTPDCE